MAADQKAQIAADGSAKIRAAGISGNPRHGQALLELAIFGSLLLMVLSVLVNYGFNADVTQRAVMQSFRHALDGARHASKDSQGQPSGMTYLLIQDKHIPNPANPFAIGSTTPVIASAGGFVRSHRLGGMPVKETELPLAVVQMDGATCPGSRLSPAGSKPPCKYLLAGFRTEEIQPKSLSRYHLIYGRLSVCAKADRPNEKNCCDGQGCGDGCRRPGVPDPVTGVAPCLEPFKTIRIVDTCEGEILSRDTCVRQLRMIRDDMACEDQCTKGKSPADTIDCRTVCQQPMGSRFPWYATLAEEEEATHVPGGAHRWGSLALDLFFGQVKSLGLQPDSLVKETTMDSNLTKSEGEVAISTTASIDWTERTTRKFESRPHGGGLRKRETVTAVSERAQKPEDPNATWTVPW